MHKPGFKLQARILNHLFRLASSEAIRAPLWDVNSTSGGVGAYPNNAAFVHAQLALLLQTSFPNLRPQQIEVRCVRMCVRWLQDTRKEGVEHDVPFTRASAQ